MTRNQVDYLLKRNADANTCETENILISTENRALRTQVKSLQDKSAIDSTMSANNTEAFMICDSRLNTVETKLEKETFWKKFFKTAAAIGLTVIAIETSLIYFTLKQ